MQGPGEYHRVTETKTVKHERDPMSGWMMAFLVLVVLVGLGFISLMDLSSQQAKTERAIFEIRQELRRSKHVAQRPPVQDPLEEQERTSPEEVYSRLNENGTADNTTPAPVDAKPAPVAPPPDASDPKPHGETNQGGVE